jgi:hypothetical protein
MIRRQESIRKEGTKFRGDGFLLKAIAPEGGIAIVSHLINLTDPTNLNPLYDRSRPKRGGWAKRPTSRKSEFSLLEERKTEEPGPISIG